MPVVPFIPLIAAGIGLGGTALANKGAKDRQKTAAQTAANDPLAISQKGLIDHQTEVGKWGFEQSKSLLGPAKQAIDLPFSHFKAVLGGNQDEFNKVLSGPNQAIDQQTNSARKNISEFAPRGAIAGQLAQLATGNAQAKQGNYFQAYMNALTGAQTSATQYGNLFNSVLSAGQNAGVPALSSLTQMQGFQTQRDLQSEQLRANSMQGLGAGIGSLLTALMMTQRGGGNSRSSSSSSGPSYSPGSDDWG